MKTCAWATVPLILNIWSVICWGAEIVGPSVYLNNIDANHPIYYQTVGNLAAGPDFYVEILGGPDVGHLQPVAVASRDITIFSIGTSSAGPGFFDGVLGIIPGYGSVGPVVATFQALAWKGATTFDAASQRVASATWTQMTGYIDLPPGPPTGVPLQFPANLVIPAIPEPAITTLWLAACVALLVIRWRG